MDNRITVRNLIFGIIMGLIVMFNALAWGNFVKDNKKNSKINSKKFKEKNNEFSTSINNSTESNNIDDNNYEIKAGYRYKKSNGNGSTFTSRNLGYAEKLLNDSTLYDSLKSEYCAIVNEIVKVDNGIMPGTDIPFEKVTYTQVDDAYKEHLQQIAQIRQVFDTIYGNDNDLENGTGCHYTGTHWNNTNSQYKAKQFYNRSIIKYLNNHGYGIKNNASSTLKRKEKNPNNEREIEIERTIDETINEIDGTTNQIDQTQNNNSTNSDESDDEYSE